MISSWGDSRQWAVPAAAIVARVDVNHRRSGLAVSGRNEHEVFP